MSNECPNCGQVTNTSHLRLVKDNCGHAKCRMCLICEEQGCKICINERSLQSIGNYGCSPLTEGIQNNTSTSDKSHVHNELLPLELVINKDSKSKTNDVETIPIDCLNNCELRYENIFNDVKETQKQCTTDVKSNDSSNKIYVSNVESNNLHAYPHLNNNLINSSCDTKTSEKLKAEFNSKERLSKSKTTKCNRNHIITIPGSPEKYKCNICLKIFRNKKGKCYHDACVTGVKPYQCTFCDRSFIKQSHFEYHERIHRGYKPYKCNLCEKAFPQKNKLNRHMYSHSREKQFKCPKCDKRYIKQDDLRNHLNIHNSTTTYSCKACEKTFKMLTNLKRHLKTHTSERPYKCDECNKSFKQTSLLKRHKKTHGKDRPFSCAHCTRVFLSKSELRRHIAVHSDEKPFSCTYCEVVFRRKDNLHRHIRHHHLESQTVSTNKAENEMSVKSTKLSKATQINLKQKQKARKIQEVSSNLLPKTPTKLSVVCISSCDQISSRIDSMGNITPVIRTTNELSNAVSVINGPISVKNSNDEHETKRKTFTYTEPIPLAEAVVINKRIEEKLYPQTLSNNSYLFRNCLNCTDKSYPSLINHTSRANGHLKSKLMTNEDSLSAIKTSVTYNIEKQSYNKQTVKVKDDSNSNRVLSNSKEKCSS